MSEKKSKKFSLKNLRIEEISGVDKGANPGAHVLFFKRNQKEPKEMDLEKLAKKVEGLEKNLGDSQDQIKKLEAEKETLAALAKMSDAEKTFYKSLSDDDKSAFLKMSDEDRKSKMDDEEDKKKTKKALDDNKDDVTKAIEGATKPLQKSLEEANAEIKKLRDEKDLAEFEKTFDAELPNFGGTSDEKTALLKSLKAMDEASRTTLMKSLKQADEIKGDYFIEKGAAGRGADDPVTKLDVLAKKRAEEKGEEYSLAYAKVLETPEGQKLYAASGKN